MSENERFSQLFAPSRPRAGSIALANGILMVLGIHFRGILGISQNLLEIADFSRNMLKWATFRDFLEKRVLD